MSTRLLRPCVIGRVGRARPCKRRIAHYTLVMAIQLETGEFLLSAEQVRELRAAADALRERGLRSLDLTRPITFEDWFDLVVAQATLNGDEDTVDSLRELLEAEIAKRKRLN
jgi:benzoyl-CoA reductase/2-hydroxyglutaryl-CoA dehydratase subunit BcrC/BadD/HgdB